MDHKSSNKIRDTVRMHQLLKKWRRFALAPAKTNPATSSNSARKFLRKALSFSDNYALSVTASVPKGCFAVCVGEQMKRYVVPTACLSHAAFVGLLREAEEEFGFAQAGVLRIPCDVSEFELVLQIVLKRKNGLGSTVYCSMAAANGVRDQHRHQKSV